MTISVQDTTLHLLTFRTILIWNICDEGKNVHNQVIMKQFYYHCFFICFLVLLLLNHIIHLQMLALLSLLLAYAYSCNDVEGPRKLLSGYCNLISITKASPITHMTVIGYFLLIIIQIVSIPSDDNSPFKARICLFEFGN